MSNCITLFLLFTTDFSQKSVKLNVSKGVNYELILMTTCELCKTVPIHSFYMTHRTDTHIYFYTCQANVIDRTPEYVASHISGELEALVTPGITWSWHYDAREFQFDLCAIDIFMRLLDIFKTHGSSLTEIYIQPNNMMRLMLQVVHPMLPDALGNRLRFE